MDRETTQDELTHQIVATPVRNGREVESLTIFCIYDDSLGVLLHEAVEQSLWLGLENGCSA
jgi:hypothetical protein